MPAIHMGLLIPQHISDTASRLASAFTAIVFFLGLLFAIINRNAFRSTKPMEVI
jgi:hypothetical protein